MAEGLAATLITRGSTAARQLAQSDTQALLPPQPIVKTAVIQWSFNYNALFTSFIDYLYSHKVNNIKMLIALLFDKWGQRYCKAW